MAITYTNIDPANPPKAETKKIWVTFMILVAITGVEFLFAFFFPKALRGTLITIYVTLTLLKAYFIVSEFMHLGHERKSLVYSIVLPMIFVVWFVVALIVEANYFWDSKFDYNNTMFMSKKEMMDKKAKEAENNDAKEDVMKEDGQEPAAEE